MAFRLFCYNIKVMYDASKETDKDFLRAALKKVQEKNILLEKELALRDKQKIKDEEICKKLAEELFLLRKSIYDSKAEQREKGRERARQRREREKKRKNKNLPHNRPENSVPIEKIPEISLEQEIEQHKLEDESQCPNCGSGEGFAPINSSEESGEIEVVERRYIFKRHQRQKYHCKSCKFVDALSFDESARPVVDWIDDLYDIEHEADALGALSELRKEKSAPVVEKIDSWVDSMEGHYLDSTTLGKAINYYNERKKGLHLFLTDKNIPIDNNMAERRQRCPVMGRKNFLHFKSINGADVGVFFYSVIESCKTNGLPARAYINEMAHRVVGGEELESPYEYSSRLTKEIGEKLRSEFGQL